MLRRILHGVMIGKECLQDDLTRSSPSSCTPSHLGQQLKRSLGCAKIRHTQRHVGAHDSHKGDSMHVVTLRDHLCADKQVEFARIEGTEHTLEIFAAPNCVTVEPPDSGLRKHSMQQLLKFL